jgi:HSP20 family protein
MFGDLLSLESSLWNEFERLQQEMDDLFTRPWGRLSIRSVTGEAFPAFNVGESPDAVHVYMFAPGLDPKTLDLSIQRNLLTIAGERRIEEPKAGAEVYRRERFSGTFRRVLSLPEEVNPELVNAVYHDGVLGITIAKKETAKPRQIPVNV